MSDKKRSWNVFPSFEETERAKQEEEDYWASLAGPVTIRYKEQDDAS